MFFLPFMGKVIDFYYVCVERLGPDRPVTLKAVVCNKQRMSFSSLSHAVYSIELFIYFDKIASKILKNPLTDLALDCCLTYRYTPHLF